MIIKEDQAHKVQGIVLSQILLWAVEKVEAQEKGIEKMECLFGAISRFSTNQ